MLFGNKPWDHCEHKASSLLYLCIGTEGRRSFKSKHPYFLIEKRVDERTLACNGRLFRKKSENNVWPLRFLLKTKKANLLRFFFGRLIEKSAIEGLWVEVTTLTRDTFIINMLEYDTQKELLKETVSPTKALEIATLMEMGSQNKQKINHTLNTNPHSVNIVYNFHWRNRTTNYQQQRKHFTR